MKAELITIGDEILIGQIVDTNSAWLGIELNKIGISVSRINSISDNANEIASCLSSCLKRVDLVIITGGLGPTEDDITKQTLATFFESNLIFHPEIFSQISEMFNKRNIPVLEVNRQQAFLPEKCEVLQNMAGTASGMLFNTENKIVISLPGVPYEMKHIMRSHVLPKLKTKFNLESVVNQTILTSGVGEAELANRLSDWANSLKEHSVKLAYLPSIGRVRLRLSGDSNTKEVIDKKVSELKMLIPELIYGFNNDTLEGAIGDLLLRNNFSLSVAESCTGGAISAKITSVSGSSAYFFGGVTAYSNSIKENILRVTKSDIDNYGAVSEQVIRQMAQGVKQEFKSSFSIATSGIAGPSGGSEEKPVGTVWIAVSSPKGTKSKCFNFGNDRARNIERSAVAALNMLRKQIIYCLDG